MDPAPATKPVAPRTDAAHWVIRVAGVLYAVGVGLLALAVYVDLPGFLDAYGDPRASWPVAVNLVAGLLAYGTWRWANRRNTRPFAVVLLGLGVATVLVLASASYAACPEDRLSTGWSVVTRVVGLLTNNYAIDMFAAPGCDTGGVPLALQFARLTQLIVLLVAATSALAALLRTQVDRVAVRWSPRLSVVLGADATSAPLLRALAADSTGSRWRCSPRTPRRRGWGRPGPRGGAWWSPTRAGSSPWSGCSAGRAIDTPCAGSRCSPLTAPRRSG